MYPSKPGQSHDFMSRFVFFCFTGLNLTFVDAITMTWYEAKALCENMNSHLVEIFSEAQQTIIKELAKSKDNNNLGWWIGLTDKEVEGTFKWYHSNKPAVYTNWYHTYGYGNSDIYHYVAIYMPLSYDFKWLTRPNTGNYYAICQTT